MVRGLKFLAATLLALLAFAAVAQATNLRLLTKEKGEEVRVRTETNPTDIEATITIEGAERNPCKFVMPNGKLEANNVPELEVGLPSLKQEASLCDTGHGENTRFSSVSFGYLFSEVVIGLKGWKEGGYPRIRLSPNCRYQVKEMAGLMTVPRLVEPTVTGEGTLNPKAKGCPETHVFTGTAELREEVKGKPAPQVLYLE